jgi:hypothetical protein
LASSGAVGHADLALPVLALLPPVGAGCPASDDRDFLGHLQHPAVDVGSYGVEFLQRPPDSVG